MTDRETDKAPSAAMDEFMASVDAMNTGVTEMMAAALRVQTLMLEDAQNMLNEFGAIFEAAAEAHHKDDPAAEG